MYPKYKKWLFLAIVALIPILSGCDGCDKKKYVAPPPAPSAPSNLSDNAVSSTQIDLSWKDNSTNEKGFYVYRRTTGSYARVAIMETNATSYSNSGLSPETTYWYKITAYNDGGESGSSNEVNVTTLSGLEPKLEAPTNLSIGSCKYGEIWLFWTDNSDIEDGFKVYCDIDGGGYQLIHTLGKNDTRFEHYQLQPRTEYKYYVQAYKGEAYANSNKISATTPWPPIELHAELHRHTVSQIEVTGELQSYIGEPCQVEITAHFFDEATEDLIDSKKIIVDMRGFELVSFSIVYYEPEATDCRCTVEITDVEIYY